MISLAELVRDGSMELASGLLRTLGQGKGFLYSAARFAFSIVRIVE